MAVCSSSSSSCCWSTPPARAPHLPLGRPSPSMASATLSSSKPVPRILSAGPKWRCEPLPGTPLHRGAACACSGSSATGEAPSPAPCNRIFIKGLPNSTSEGRLVKIFSQFGDVKGVKIITSKISKQTLGLAYVWFASEEDAQLAVKEMDGKFVDGRFIYVTVAKPVSPTRPTRRVSSRPYKF